MGLSSSDMTDLQNTWAQMMNLTQAKVLEKGGFDWRMCVTRSKLAAAGRILCLRCWLPSSALLCCPESSLPSGSSIIRLSLAAQTASTCLPDSPVHTMLCCWSQV